MSYLDKKDVFENVEKLKSLGEGSEEFRLFGIKIICSYTKPLILSKKGVDHGSILWDKYVAGDELSRSELFEVSIIGSEAALILDRLDWIRVSASIHKELTTKYRPEDEYIQSLIMDIYLPKGYFDDNTNFIQSIYSNINEILKGKSNIRDVLRDDKNEL